MIDDLLTFLFFAALFLTILAVVGHGLWVMTAAILRLFSGRRLESTGQSGRCPLCHHPNGLADGLCHACEYQTETAIQRDLAATRRQLRRLLRDGRIDSKQHDALLNALAARRPGIPTNEKPFTTSESASPPSRPTAQPDSGGKSPDTISHVPTYRSPPTPPATSDTPIPEPASYQISPSAAEQLPSSDVPVNAEIVEDSVDSDSATLDPLFAPDESDHASTPARGTLTRHTLADMLQTFMEEKNIRWGELASGLLIVGSAIGLVISLRSTLSQLAEAVPYFPALMLMLGTAAIHGVGLYTLKRWHLRATSRGVLVIATLLVPLSFAAGILLAGTGPDKVPISSPWYLLAVLVGLAGYGAVTTFSARALSPVGWWRIVVAVIGTSLGQLIINRVDLAMPESSPVVLLTLLFAVPLIAFIAATAGQLIAIAQRRRLTLIAANQTFLVLGVSLFSLAVPFVLLVWNRVDARVAVNALSPSLSIVAAVVTSLGIAFYRRCTSKSMASIRTVGTALAILGGMSMAAIFVVAWPDPIMLMLVGSVTAVVLVLLAVAGQTPLLHAGAIGSASLTALIAMHWAQGCFDPVSETTGRLLLGALLMGRSAWLLSLASLASGGIGGWWVTRKRLTDAAVCVATALALTISAIAIAAYAGFWSRVDGDGTTWLFLAYAVVVLSVVFTWHRLSLDRLLESVRSELALLLPNYDILKQSAFPRAAHESLGWLGAGLLATFLVHLLGWNEWINQQLSAREVVLNRPILVALLAHGLLVEFLGLGYRTFANSKWFSAFGASGPDPVPDAALRPLGAAGAISATLAVPASIFVTDGLFVHHAAYMACIASTWLLASWVTRREELRIGAHVVATIAVGFATAAAAQKLDWISSGLSDLRHWQLQLSVLALWIAGAGAVRWAIRFRQGERGKSVSGPLQAFDGVLLSALVVGLLAIGVIGCGPGLLVEAGHIVPDDQLAQDNWHMVAYGVGSWIALGCLGLAFAISITEDSSTWKWSGILLTTSAIPLFASARFEDQQAVASALRWSAAIFTFLWLNLLAWDRRLWRSMAAKNSTIGNLAAEDFQQLRALAACLGLLPILGVTSWIVTQTAAGTNLGGPAADSFFGNMPTALLYGAPLALLVVSLQILAVRDRQPTAALVGMFVLEYLIILAIALPVLEAGASWSTTETVMLMQWSAIGLSIFGGVWQLLARWIEPPETRLGSWHLQTNLLLASLATLTLPFTALGWLVVEPNGMDLLVIELGNWPSYVATAICGLACYWHVRHQPHWKVHVAFACLMTFCTIFAATAAKGNSLHPWLSYHTLIGLWLTLGWVAVSLSCWHTWRTTRPAESVSLARWATAITAAVAGLILRGCIHDPWNPWWTLTSWGVAMAAITALGIRGRSQRFAYATLPMVMFAASYSFFEYFLGGTKPSFLGAPIQQYGNAATLFYWNVIGVCLAAAGWLLVEIWYQRERSEPFDKRFQFLPIHSLTAGATLALMLLVVVGGTFATTLSRLPNGSTPIHGTMDPWSVSALTALGALLIATLWDRRANRVGLALYLWGILVLTIVIQAIENVGPWGANGTVVAGGLALGGYVALTGHFWKWGTNLVHLARRAKIPEPAAKLENVSYWLPAFTIVGTVAVTALGFAVVLVSDTRAMRMMTAFAPLMASYGIACFAQPQRRLLVQCASILVASLAAVFIGWADIAPSVAADIPILYVARLLIVLAGLTLLLATLIARWLGPEHGWYQAVQRTALMEATGAVTSLVALLSLEFITFQSEGVVALGSAEVIAISVMLAGLVVALLSMAVLPGRDPLQLTEKGRTAYVYIAQAISALLFAHVYLTKPELFATTLKPYWPYFVVLLAFASVAFGEFCHRRGWRVIAEPMQRTGGWLPLLPAIGTWVFASQADYAAVLFWAGIVYALLSFWRRSFLASLAAAVAGNGALWALLYEQGYVLNAVPQFWLIPPAASVLLAAHVNRNRLDQRSLTAIRYISIMIIYLSSSGEMFMKMMAVDGPGGMSRPIILASLAVGGMLLGILLRVRAFLYLGASFLLLSIFAMVWQAARLLDHTWPWWVFGISLGLLILVVFGMFEKYRQEIQRLIDRLREWQP
jgi:hypothetical protein